VPVGLTGLVLAPLLITESRDLRVKRFDAIGAMLVTGGLVTLVYAITQANDFGWASWQTISLFAGSVAFSGPPPPGSSGTSRHSSRSRSSPADAHGSNVAAFLMGTMLFSMFLLLTLYMQQVLGYSAMQTGVAYLACAGTAIIWANVARSL
jgi:hypothetical protein